MMSKSGKDSETQAGQGFQEKKILWPTGFQIHYFN